MIKKNQYIINLFNIVIDIFLIITSFILVFQKLEWNKIAIYTVCFWFALAFQGLYNTDRFFKIRQKAIRIVISGVLSTLVMEILYNSNLNKETNEKILWLFLISSVFLLLKYTFMRMLVNIIRSKGWNLRHCVVIGTGSIAINYAKEVKTKKSLGYKVFGFIGESNDNLPGRLICNYDGLEDFLYNTEVDEIIIALDEKDEDKIHKIIRQCERNGIPYSIMLSTFFNDIGNIEIKDMGKTQLIAPATQRLNNIGWMALKRFFDIIVSFLGIVVLSPLMLLIAIVIKMSNPGSVLFRQERVGYNRKKFVMLKFRSMIPNEGEDCAWSGKEDNRRTTFGRFIRKCSLDELPQLFNVLSGSMSLIGPRPESPFYVNQFRKTIPGYMKRHQVRPGISGWAQINGLRGDTSIEKRVSYDLWYIKNWSIWLDIRILLKTVFGGMINDETVISHKN